MKLLSVDHRMSAGIYNFICTETMNHKNHKMRHVEKWHSQTLCDGDYTVNRAMVVAEFVSGGSRGQLNQRLELQNMEPVNKHFYEAEKVKVAEACELAAKLNVKIEWEKFKRLPLRLRIVEFDMRHSKSRSALHSSFEALSKHSHKICNLMNVDTKKQTGNSWLNENYAVEQFFELCWKEKVQLYLAAHDQCKKASSFIALYNERMTKWAADNGVQFEPCIDANDLWHGGKSIAKTWDTEVDLHCKVRKRKTQNITVTDDTIGGDEKDTARAQLRRIRPRVMQAMGQVCHACMGDKELAVVAYQSMLENCILNDDHRDCVSMLGEDCPCAVDKRIRLRRNALLKDSRELAAEEQVLAAVNTEDNAYAVRERMLRRAKACKALPPKMVSVEAEEDDDEDNDDDDDNDGGVFVDAAPHDPFQPVDLQLTHPLAIKVFKLFIGKAKVAAILRKQSYCVNTCFVESFHNVILTYAPKRKHFSKTYAARVGLATLDWNENIERLHIETESGATRLPEKTFKFQKDLLAQVHPHIRW